MTEVVIISNSKLKVWLVFLKFKYVKYEDLKSSYGVFLLDSTE